MKKNLRTDLFVISKLINDNEKILDVGCGIGGSSKFPGLSSYSSSKGALNILTEVLATEFKEGPYFNALCLGAVKTRMLELAFPGYNAEVNLKIWLNLYMIFLLQILYSLMEK